MLSVALVMLLQRQKMHNGRRIMQNINSVKFLCTLFYLKVLGIPYIQGYLLCYPNWMLLKVIISSCDSFLEQVLHRKERDLDKHTLKDMACWTRSMWAIFSCKPQYKRLYYKKQSTFSKIMPKTLRVCKDDLCHAI